jgi:hypothetical protein
LEFWLQPDVLEIEYGFNAYTMQKKKLPFQIYPWLSWLIFITLEVALVLLADLTWHSSRFFHNAVTFLHVTGQEYASGYGLSDWQWILFLFTSLLAMYRIAQGEIKQDGRGLLVCFSGVLLFALAMRLGDIPRAACFGLPLMFYGGARHIFGPVGKCMLIPSLILLLMISIQPITWFENSFLDNVKRVVVWSGGTIEKLRTSFICDNNYYVSVLRDTLTSLLLLFFLSRMRVSKMLIIGLLVLIWSYVAAVGIYAFAYSDTSTFQNMPVNTLARGAGWLLPLVILAYEIFRRRGKKFTEIS